MLKFYGTLLTFNLESWEELLVKGVALEIKGKREQKLNIN